VIEVGIRETNPPGTDLQDVLIGGSAGGAASAATGVLLASSYCGPYFYAVCVGAMTAGGIIAGAIYESGWNIFDIGVSTWERELADEDAKRLMMAASQLDRQTSLNESLAIILRKKLPNELQLLPQAADIQALPSVDSISFNKTYDDLVRMQVSTSLTFDNGLQERSAIRGKRKFIALSESRAIDDWLSNDGQLFRKALERCLRWNAKKMSELIMRKVETAE
jgi:hypothetical protein